MGAFTNAVISGVSQPDTLLAATSIRTMVNGQVLFTVPAGGVAIYCLKSYCVTGNDATASTILYTINPTVGTSTNICAASSTLASAVPGTIVVLPGDNFATAAIVAPTSVVLNTTARGTVFEAGTLTLTVNVGSTTGTWYHFIQYKPLVAGSYVVAS